MRRLAPAGPGAACLAAVLMATGGPSPARAQSPPDTSRLSIFTAVERAESAFPSLGISRAGRDQARAAWKEAGAAWYPTLRLSNSTTRFQEPMPVTPIHGFTLAEAPPFDRTLIQSTASLRFTLFDGGGRGRRISGARSQLAEAEARLDGSRQSLMVRVVSSFLDVVGRRQELEAHDLRISALRSEEGRVRQRLDAGRAAQVELLRVQAALAAAEADRVELAATLDRAERDLGRLTDLPVAAARASRLDAVSLADTTLEPREQWTEAALQGPAIQQARQQHAAARAALGIARSARWPDLELVANTVDWRSPEGRSSLEWNAGVQVSVPLFTGGALGQRIARADAGRRGAEDQLRLAEIGAREAVDRAFASVIAARARVTSLALAVERLSEVARIEKLRLESGTGTQTDYLGSEADLLTARASHIRALHGEIAARVELARVGGVLTLEWLHRTLEERP